MRKLMDSRSGASRSFSQVAAAFLVQPGLPFAKVLSAERIERVFTKHGNLFGGGAIYSTAIMVWSFLSQVLRDGKEASCQAAVARVVSYCEQQGVASPTSDTGDYCRARAKLSEAALHELSGEVAEELEQAADPSWLWKASTIPNCSTASRSRCPTLRRTKPSIRNRKLNSPEWGCPSRGLWQSSRWPRPA